MPFDSPPQENVAYISSHLTYPIDFHKFEAFPLKTILEKELDKVTSVEIDCITQAIASILMKLMEDDFLQPIRQKNLDDKVRIKASLVHERIRILMNSAKNNYNKKFVSDLKNILNTLSLIYLESLFLPEYHSFKSLSARLAMNDEETFESLLQEINELGKLNNSVIVLKSCLNLLLERISEIQVTGYLGYTHHQAQNLLKSSLQVVAVIRTMRESYTADFLKEVDKSQDQQLLQTIKALQLSDLSKIEYNLNILIHQLQTLVFIDPSCIVDAQENLNKVVIFTCSYGTGHNVTASAIQQTLQEHAIKSKIYDLSTGVLLGKDRVRSLFKFFGIHYEDHPFNSVDLFNMILRNQLYAFINTKDTVDQFIRKMLDISGKSGVASRSSVYKNSWEKTQIREILLVERPDHIITTYHMDLNPILEVAEEMGIPVLHVPTDYNMKFWEVFDTIETDYSHFKSLIPNEDIAETLATQTPLSAKRLVHDVGIPLRKEFYSFLSEKGIQDYRKCHSIKKNEKVLYLSAGGNGQNLPHPELLVNSSTWKIPVRLVIIAGKNRDFVTHLQKKLRSIGNNSYLLRGKNPYVTVEIMVNPDLSEKGTEKEFFIPASELSKLLDNCDAAIAKAGGVSVAELLFKGVPILFDQRVHPFSWELFNIDVVTRQGMGLSNYSLKNFEEDLLCLLEIPKKQNAHFYFEFGREILLQTIFEQIEKAKADPSIASKKW